MSETFECKICGRFFEKRRGLHLHIGKAHNMKIPQYYKDYETKLSKLYKKKIPFKNINDYLQRDFINREELILWCNQEKKEIVKEYCEKILTKRKNDKSLKYSLGEIELELCELPTINVYKNIFGSYSRLCEKIGLKNLSNKPMPEDFFENNEQEEDLKIFIDTREQKPINFKSGEPMKLDFGDYTCGGNYYDYTYVDRKSEQDLKGTLSGDNFERFKRELERARTFNSFIFIAVESSIEKIIKNNNFTPYKSKLPYIWHNLKFLSQEYKDVCQFVFAGNRNGLKKIIPKILLYGKKIWNVDIQYFINERAGKKR
jgi:hypothetical protein